MVSGRTEKDGGSENAGSSSGGGIRSSKDGIVSQGGRSSASLGPFGGAASAVFFGIGVSLVPPTVSLGKVYSLGGAGALTSPLEGAAGGAAAGAAAGYNDFMIRAIRKRQTALPSRL